MARAVSRRLSLASLGDATRAGRSKFVEHVPSMRRLSPVEEDAVRRGCVVWLQGLRPCSAPRVRPSDEWWVRRFDALLQGLAADLSGISASGGWHLYRGRRGPLVLYELYQYAPGEVPVRMARVTCVQCAGVERERLMCLRRVASRSPPAMRRMEPLGAGANAAGSPRPAADAPVTIGICCEGLGPGNVHSEMVVYNFMDHCIDTEAMRVRAIITGMCFT